MLKIAAFPSSSGKLMSMTANAEDVYSVLARPFEQELTHSSRLYQLFELQRIARYKKAREEVKQHGYSKVAVQLQDLYIFNDEHMPSTTGRVEKAYQNEIISWAAILGLLDKDNYSLTPKGYVLKMLMKEDYSQALEQYSPSLNPFLIDDKEKILFLYLILENDGDVLRRFLPKLEDLNGIFDRTIAGQPVRETLGEILEEASTSDSEDPETLERLQRIARVKEELDRQWELEKTSGKRKPGQREHQVTWRLESLADLGLLSKEKAHLHKYDFSESGHRLCHELRNLSDVGEYLGSRFFESMNDVFDIGARPARSSAVIERHLVRGYIDIKNPQWIAPIEETVLLSAIHALFAVSHRVFFGITQGREHVKSMQTEHLGKVRLTVDSRGQFAYLELDRNFASELLTSVEG